ncbi:mitochondrial 54S ribosomal protein uL23m Ecym_4537 [Eremothecium cymbalariae DBVPG|uniref:Large ribosomal subunit protein uL23m n=1 Tax=Eremothecium cymbalariae (strain CBS 270.75 / DBVPG 7215 / KCTC 17166 / NRRL Y-17582) TaxID=931890 RepID=G8JU70_ERECY|nr:hypothetical protein Ecym_4537 [Eremothecium cymbalariae DBVPG\
MPRLSNFFRGASRSLATVTKEVTEEVTQGEVGKMSVQEKIFKLTENAIAEGKAHFRVGGKQLYFPKARVILLRPNAKHTPYQAKFIVPKSFNKLDLRDYLFHIYGLRVLNVTTQLMHGKFVRERLLGPRYRAPQIKKMTVDMMEPFIWPEEPKETRAWMVPYYKELGIYANDKMRMGSDAERPSTAFGGALGPYKAVAQPFVPKRLQSQIINKKNRMQAKLAYLSKLLKVDRYAS